MTTLKTPSMGNKQKEIELSRTIALKVRELGMDNGQAQATCMLMACNYLEQRDKELADYVKTA